MHDVAGLDDFFSGSTATSTSLVIFWGLGDDAYSILHVQLEGNAGAGFIVEMAGAAYLSRMVLLRCSSTSINGTSRWVSSESPKKVLLTFRPSPGHCE